MSTQQQEFGFAQNEQPQLPNLAGRDPKPLALKGCTPEPLMNYLKALGVFRIVSEQVDDQCRAAWQGSNLRLYTRISQLEIERFFLESYAPSPIVAPWGARSGFYPGSSESSARAALEEIRNCSIPRLSPFKRTILEVRSQLERLDLSEKAKDEDKLNLLFDCRSELSDEILAWLDTCYVLLAEDRKFPPLLGTGGNEGSGSYVSLFAQQIVTALIKRNHDELLSTALFATPGKLPNKGPAPGHFSPETTHGPNGSQGFSGGTNTNPWDYILALEGTLLWTSGVSRKTTTAGGQMAAFPFMVNVVGAGSETLPENDSHRPKQAKRDIAEMWAPLWHRPLKLAELQSILSEGRLSLHKRSATNGMEAARAISTLGVDKGIDQFSRFSFLMRNGQSFMAVKVDRLDVGLKEDATLLNDLDRWLSAYRRGCNKDAPARFRTALRKIDSSIFDFCKFGGKERFQAILIALGQAERELGTGVNFRESAFLPPLRTLSEGWVTAADDQSPEFQIACGLAGIYGAAGKLAGLRANMEPVAIKNGKLDWNEESKAFVWKRGNLSENMLAALERRVLDADRLDLPLLPLQSSSPVSIAAISAFIAEELDEEKIEALLWGLICCKNIPWNQRVDQDSWPLPRQYALLKATLSGFGKTTTQPKAGGWGDTFEKLKSVRPEPRLLQLLRSGRLAEATALASQRLRNSGLAPAKVDWSAEVSAVNSTTLRLAAALLIPISPASLLRQWELVSRGERETS